MQKNLTPLTTAVERVVAQHRAILADAEAKAAAARDALAATQAADKAALEPVAQAAAALADKLTELVSRRDTLTEELSIGRRQLACQQGIAGAFTEILEKNYGHPYAAQNPVFHSILESHPHGLLALVIVPRLEKWLAEKESNLESVEAEVADLAKSAKPPVK